MDWFNEIKEGFIVPRIGFEPMTYGLEIDCMIDSKIKKYYKIFENYYVEQL